MQKLIEAVEALESPWNDSYVTRQAVIALIRKHEAQCGWQPIETAPKNGTHILGYSAEGCGVVYWNKYGEYWNLSECGAYAENGEWFPTLWMPLPATPTKHIQSTPKIEHVLKDSGGKRLSIMDSHHALRVMLNACIGLEDLKDCMREALTALNNEFFIVKK